MIFCIVALSETCIVLFLAYHDTPDLLPPWIVELLAACFCRRRGARPAPTQVVPTDAETVSLGAWTKLTAQQIAKADTSLASAVARSMDLLPPHAGEKAPTADACEGASEEASWVDGVARLSLFERFFAELVPEHNGTGPSRTASARDPTAP